MLKGQRIFDPFGKNWTVEEIDEVMNPFDAVFERTYQHYHDHVQAFARRRVPADAVDDVVSETFVVAWRRRDVLPDDALPWLYAAARNIVGNRYRSDSRWKMLAERMSQVPVESGPDPADGIIARDRLVAAMALLSEDDQELLILLAWEDLQPREIAQVLGLSPGTVSVRIHRTRSRLRRAMTAHDVLPKENR